MTPCFLSTKPKRSKKNGSQRTVNDSESPMECSVTSTWYKPLQGYAPNAHLLVQTENIHFIKGSSKIQNYKKKQQQENSVFNICFFIFIVLSVNPVFCPVLPVCFNSKYPDAFTKCSVPPLCFDYNTLNVSCMVFLTLFFEFVTLQQGGLQLTSCVCWEFKRRKRREGVKYVKVTGAFWFMPCRQSGWNQSEVVREG